MWQLFIVTFFDWQEIQFDQVWSSLIHFGQIWSKKKFKNKTVIFILSVNMTSFHWKIYKLVRKSNLIMFDPFWTDLIKKNQKVNLHFYPFCKCDIYTDIFRLVSNPIWSSLIHFGKIWSKKKVIFILVTFFDWYEIQFDQVWSILIHLGQILSKKIKN